MVAMAPFDKETTEYTVKTAIYAIFMPPFYGDDKVTRRRTEECDQVFDGIIPVKKNLPPVTKGGTLP